MKKSVIPYFNTIILIACIAGYALFEYADTIDKDEGSKKVVTRSTKSESQKTKKGLVKLETGADVALLERVEKLELQVSQLKSELKAARKELKRPRPVAAKKEGGEKGSELAESEPLDLSKDELKELVKAQIKEVNEEAKKEWAKKAKEGRKEKTLSAVSEELNLSANQEQDISQLIEGLERESFKVLFKVKDEELNTLLQQLEQAKTNPKLKAELREKMMINWTKNSKDVSVLYIKFDSQLRKMLPSEKVQKFYSYKVRRDNSPYPDLEEYFKDPGAQGVEGE